jgi:hypothetical protein
VLKRFNIPLFKNLKIPSSNYRTFIKHSSKYTMNLPSSSFIFSVIFIKAFIISETISCLTKMCIPSLLVLILHRQNPQASFRSGFSSNKRFLSPWNKRSPRFSKPLLMVRRLPSIMTLSLRIS